MGDPLDLEVIRRDAHAMAVERLVAEVLAGEAVYVPAALEVLSAVLVERIGDVAAWVDAQRARLGHEVARLPARAFMTWPDGRRRAATPALRGVLELYEHGLGFRGLAIDEVGALPGGDPLTGVLAGALLRATERALTPRATAGSLPINVAARVDATAFHVERADVARAVVTTWNGELRVWGGARRLLASGRLSPEHGTIFVAWAREFGIAVDVRERRRGVLGRLVDLIAG